MLQLLCAVCKNDFKVKPYRKEAKFCSKKCFGVSIKGIVPKTAFKKGLRSSPKTEFKAGNKHPYFGKSSPALGKKWKLSEETKEKMSKAQKGKPHPWVTLTRKGCKVPSNSSELHPEWKGEDAAYNAKHSWVRRKLGRPDTCEHCGKSGLKGREIHWANKDHTYKRNLKDWIRLCIECHWKYDKKYN